MSSNKLRVLIVADHASFKFGGEAALPLHYFRVLRKRDTEVWLVVHARTRDELKSLFPKDFDRIHFAPDTVWHRILCRCGKLLPPRLSYFTLRLIMRLMTQIVQRRIIKRVVQEHQINIVHQPIPVSPREPSMIFGVGVPVVIGPMNGGMSYPPAFQHLQSSFVSLSLGAGNLFVNALNTLIPGKRQATALLVANSRTRDALPRGIRGKVIELVENGVDLLLWRPKSQCDSELKLLEKTQHPAQESQRPTRFVFVGRLVDWKAVDLLLIAFKQVVDRVPAELEIVGDGPERTILEEQAKALGLMKEGTSQERDVVRFAGWLSQADCAQRLQLASALVLPSLFECGGAVVLETLAMSTPVIATYWGGPADYLDQSCGILVEPASRDSFIQDIAAAMIKVTQQPDLCQVMGRAGYQRVLDNFDWEVKVDTVLGIYQESIEQYAIEQQF